ncbi:50S ribosomal protein L17 [Chitinivibrio alkaliphilus]|uniref:Large ribosomal subunit protein bL17 n=1 Tax=Chitinivibrio alkaliphilus ACht1 TaxID=1313304 RepID=U7D465_9BACT|nr:50S ribosomal protein L17 [Chitinivibrio alkaliphilus]ERP31314.1 50S ribosomal protein L17 [Chitinivibrio alkaliphilus ACht1]
MRHLKAGRKLNRTASHRKAMFGNMAASLFKHERITTTLPKAKELRGVAERLITHGKKGNLNGVRSIAKVIKDKKLIHKITADIAPGYADRNGGYTRILKLGPRKGDKAEMAIIELVGRSTSVSEEPAEQ